MLVERDILNYFMNQEHKKKIIEYCIQQVEEDDSVRVGYAAETILGSKQENHVHDKIAAAMERLGYRKEPSRRFQFDWNITKEHKKWAERNRTFYDFILIFSTAILSLTAGWLLQKSDNDLQSQRYKQQQTDMRVLRDSLNMVEVKIETIKASLKRIK